MNHWRLISVLFVFLLSSTWVGEILLGVAEDAHAQTFTDCSAVSEIPQSECQALVDLYDSTNGDNWTTKTEWKQTSLPCSWLGVTCRGGHVADLNLGSNYMVGTIPASIGNLSNLTYLYLCFNQLSGSIPAELGNLTPIFHNG